MSGFNNLVNVSGQPDVLYKSQTLSLPTEGVQHLRKCKRCTDSLALPDVQLLSDSADLRLQ